MMNPTATFIAILVFQGKYVMEVEGRTTPRIGEDIMDGLSGKVPSLGYRFTIFPHKVKYEGKREYEGETILNGISGKISSPEFMYKTAASELKGKYEIEVGGKETARVEEEMPEESELGKEALVGGLPFTIFPRKLKEKSEGKINEEFSDKIMKTDFQGKDRNIENMETAPEHEMKGKFEGKGKEEFDGKITVNGLQVKENLRDGIENDPEYETKEKENVEANIDLCVRFFFSVQELPHYFAGVTDAILNATRNSVPLAEQLMNCTKGSSFMDTLACMRAMEPQLRDYYIAEVPLLKQPVLAFHDQFIKTKNELEGCLVIKHFDKETISNH